MTCSHRVSLFISLCASLAILSACGGAAGPAVSPTPTLPYADDFGNAKSGWSTQSDTSSEVKYDNGGLRINVKQENLTVWSTAGKNFGDAAYTVEAKPNGGPKDNGFGLLFRAKDRKNFYHFEISSDGFWRAGVMKDGKWENWDDWTPNPAIRQGPNTNKLRVVMKGDALTFFVNNQQVLQKTDKTFSDGDIGVMALTLIDAPGTDVSFDNVSVTKSE